MSRIPKELMRYGRITIYAGSDARKAKFLKLLEHGQGKSLSQLIEDAVTEFLETRGKLVTSQLPSHSQRGTKGVRTKSHPKRTLGS